MLPGFQMMRRCTLSQRMAPAQRAESQRQASPTQRWVLSGTMGMCNLTCLTPSEGPPPRHEAERDTPHTAAGMHQGVVEGMRLSAELQPAPDWVGAC